LLENFIVTPYVIFTSPSTKSDVQYFDFIRMRQIFSATDMVVLVTQILEIFISSGLASLL